MISVFKVGIWGGLCHPWKKCQLTNCVTFNAPNTFMFLRLEYNKTNFNVFFHGDSHLVKNLKDYT